MSRLIGLIGHAGAGKDTIAECLAAHRGIERLAFANKLKEVIAKLFDVPLTAFHDRHAKNEVHPNLSCGYLMAKFNPIELSETFDGILNDVGVERATSEQYDHASERDVAALLEKCAIRFENNGTIADLHNKVLEAFPPISAAIHVG